MEVEQDRVVAATALPSASDHLRGGLDAALEGDRPAARADLPQEFSAPGGVFDEQDFGSAERLLIAHAFVPMSMIDGTADLGLGACVPNMGSFNQFGGESAGRC